MKTYPVGTKIKFAEEKQRYTVQASGERYMVCSKPFNARKTVLYTVVDVEDQVRGTENLVFGAGAETQEQCEQILARLEGRDVERGWQTEVSRRNRIRLDIESATTVRNHLTESTNRPRI